MSQLDKVLRRSVSHLDPLDVEGRERVFASAREAMVRLLRVYDPPLTSGDINRKIGEFDEIVRVIEGESLAAPAARRSSLLALAAPEADPAEALPPTPPSRPRPVRAPAILPPPEPEPELEPEVLAEPELEAEAEDEALEAVEYYDDYEDYDPDDDGYYDEEDERRDGFGGFVDRIGWRTIAAAIGGLVLVLALIGGAMVMNARRGTAPVTAAAPAPTAEPAPNEPATTAAATDIAVQPDASAPAPAAPPAAGALALETLVLFDGRDPSVFQSAPENPVGFQGDADGGFARVSSSTGSTGARIPVGRGVFERIAGRTVRIVVVARAARTAPATNLRFAYQNGRIQSPWTDAALGPSYAPLSAVWTVPPERGGPENDALIIEPGIPGDDTAADIRSVRIEILQ